jgi:hypothetical protein
MRPERIIELKVGGRSKGSGYALTPRHVLTARHVINPPVEGTGCDVHPLCSIADVEKPISEWRRPPAISAQVAWVPRTEATDLAIVTLTEGSRLADISESSVVLGVLPRDRGHVRFYARGFPEASGVADREITGLLGWNIEEGLLDLDVLGSLPKEGSKWAGFSGAALFCSGVPLGVIKAYGANWDGLLHATPLQHLLDDAEFIEWWTGPQGQRRPERRVVGQAGSELAAQISLRVFRIDRGRETARIMNELRSLPAEAIPKIIAVPGRDEDEHRYLITRLATEPAIMRLLGRETSPEKVIIPLPWPAEEDTIDPDERLHLLVEELFRAANLSPPPLGASPDLKALREAFNGGDVPRGFYVLVRKAVALHGHGALLRAWLKLWEDLGNKGAGQPVILFLCLALNDPAPRPPPLLPWRRPRRIEVDPEFMQTLEEADTGNKAVFLDDLDDILPTHLPSWAKELRGTCQEDRLGLLDQFSLELLGRVGPKGVPMLTVSTEIGKLLGTMRNPFG